MNNVIINGELVTENSLEKESAELIHDMGLMFSDELIDLSQKEKIKYIKPVILVLMCDTEQSPEEKLWCDIYEMLKEEEKKL